MARLAGTSWAMVGPDTTERERARVSEQTRCHAFVALQPLRAKPNRAIHLGAEVRVRRVKGPAVAPNAGILRRRRRPGIDPWPPTSTRSRSRQANPGQDSAEGDVYPSSLTREASTRGALRTRGNANGHIRADCGRLSRSWTGLGDPHPETAASRDFAHWG